MDEGKPARRNLPWSQNSASAKKEKVETEIPQLGYISIRAEPQR